MSEPPYSPSQAVADVRSVAEFEHVLRLRVEGLTWMLMGLVFACTFLAYSVAAQSSAPTPVVLLLWVPWLGMGLAVAWGIRRAMALPTAGPYAWLFASLGIAFLLAAIAFLWDAQEIAPAVAAVGVSLLAALPAVMPALRYTSTGIRVGLVLAALGIVISLVATIAQVTGGMVPVVGSLIGACWVAAGVYEILQG